MNKRLLPIGFYDLAADDARKNYEFTKFAIDNFLIGGYQLIKTSLIEFEESFDVKNLDNVFKIIDPISRKNIFFRNDITVQISKYISSLDLNSLHQKIAYPLKLCYFGEVVNANSDELYGERQQTQVGCEIIGNSGFESYCQIINDTLKVLYQVPNLNIAISLPDFLDIVLKNIYNCDIKKLREAIINKNITEVRNCTQEYDEIISEIILSNGNFDDLNRKIINKFNNEEVVKTIDEARNLMLFIKNNFKNIAINFDLFGDNKFNYHHKIAFDIFANNFRYPIARGGCYKINNSKVNFEAVGSTIYVNYLRKI